MVYNSQLQDLQEANKSIVAAADGGAQRNALVECSEYEDIITARCVGLQQVCPRR
jgi:hypothetical protein